MSGVVSMLSPGKSGDGLTGILELRVLGLRGLGFREQFVAIEEPSFSMTKSASFRWASAESCDAIFFWACRCFSNDHPSVNSS